MLEWIDARAAGAPEMEADTDVEEVAEQVTLHSSFGSPSMEGHFIAEFQHRPACYLGTFEQDGETLLKFGRSDNPAERMSIHSRKYPKYEPWVIITCCNPTQLETWFGREMRKYKQTVRISGRAYTEVLRGI